MSFERKLNGFRYAETQFGDTIQKFAARELGDATRWPEIAWINNLLPPYITDDKRRVSDRVALAGSILLVPAPQQYVGARIDPDLVFERDCALPRGLLEDDGKGDIAVAAGRENLRQQLTHRISTEKGSLLFHPDYGCNARRLVGKINTPAAAALGAQYVKSALLSDFRVSKVTEAKATVVGDRLSVDAEIVPIVGRSVGIEADL